MNQPVTGYPESRIEGYSKESQQAPSMYRSEQAARVAYADHGSYGEILSRMFAEADQSRDYNWSPEQAEQLERQVGKSDVEAYRDVMQGIYQRLETSDTIQDYRYRGKVPSSEQDIEAIFRAYDRALGSSMKKVDLTDRQASRAKFAARSELDWSLRDVVIRHALEDADSQEHTFSPDEFLLILDPKLRKVEYMSSDEILQTLRRSASLESKDRLKADLDVLRASKRQEARAALEAHTAETAD